ncbi:hypothetical protein M2138_001663 [Dysgonomonadaceae bacterium PH5-43]|nr:hypothetical protein [Dysgonomonadaceae bacterium PH5-43]
MNTISKLFVFIFITVGIFACKGSKTSGSDKENEKQAPEPTRQERMLGE